MNMLKKSIALFIVIVMVLAAVPAAFAADCLPGNTVTVKLDLGKGYGFDGDITVSDPDGIISSVKFTGPDGFSDFEVIASGSGYTAYATKDNVSTAGNLVISAKVTLKNNSAKAGNSATISYSGNVAKYSETTGDYNERGTASAKVTMVKPAPEVKIDYSELEKQIGIAEGLKQGDYTAESWAALLKALENAKNHLTSKSQSAVDQAAKELADAIAALVKMDYSKLEEAIKDGNDLFGSDKLGKLWKDLFDALLNGAGLIGSGDQAAVDAAAEKILSIIEALKKAIAEALEKDDVITEPGGCDHEGPFCNIKIHKLWPILFFISMAGNVALVVVLIVKKKKSDKE